MDTVALLARVALALVFGLAGIAKAADLRASRHTVEAFGLPRNVADVTGALLPVAELLVAVALLVQASARWGAVGALVLLIVFSAGVTVALANGRTPNCNCFGQVSSEQISWRTIARNAVFAVVAVFVVVEAPGTSLESWTTNLTAANLVAGVAVVAAALAGLGLLYFARTSRKLRRELAKASAALEPTGLRVGDEAPAFELLDLTGATVGLDALRVAGHPLVLLFATPTCGPCTELLPQLERWSVTLSEQLDFAVIESLVPDASVLTARFGQRSNLVVMTEGDLGVAAEYGVSQTPTAFLIDPDGRVATAATVGAAAIERLVRNALQTQPTAVREVA
jgi:peroxiredoxin/uncharacterized membrane protein YphA (DoxX/SURF4 family)